MTDLLLHFEHGSRLARAWLAASAAATNDAERPALHRTTLVETFDDGVRLTSTDSYWTAVAWVGTPIEPGNQHGPLMPPPARGEIAERAVPIVDHEYRIRDLMAYVSRRTTKIDAEHPDIPLTITITRDRSDDIPTLDPLFDRDRVDVQIPGVEQVAGHVNEIEYPDVARFHWQHDLVSLEGVDRVQVNPQLLRKLARACDAVNSDGCLFGFHGDPKKPISWEVVAPSSAVLSGLVMPQRQRSNDDGDAQ